jgi:hypothetical protein
MARTYTLKKAVKTAGQITLTIDVDGMVFEVTPEQDAASNDIDFDPFIRRLRLALRKGATPQSLINATETY